MTPNSAPSLSEWDAFISHASEDKDVFVRPLAEALTALGARVWYDEFSLKLGDSLSESIDRGLANSRFGIVILSPAFISKAWPRRELQGLVARELAGSSTILPVWHEVSHSEVLNFSPPLADKLAVKTSLGADKIALQILLQIRPDLADARPYEELQAIASGEATAALEAELQALRERMEDFQCPHCGSEIVRILDVPLDPAEKHWDQRREFECGFVEVGGYAERLCPHDPAFPKLSEFELIVTKLADSPGPMQWTCNALAKTDPARRISLPSGYGPTPDDARADLQAVYRRYARTE